MVEDVAGVETPLVVEVGLLEAFVVLLVVEAGLEATFELIVLLELEDGGPDGFVELAGIDCCGALLLELEAACAFE